MRITGMATGLDMDEIIKNSMKPYRIKVDQMTQKKDVVEIRQKLYRDIIKENRDFFDKHLDIAKSDSLLKASNWSSVSFTSSDESAVTAKASTGATVGNYEVSVEKLAQKATATFVGNSIKAGDVIEINNEKFILSGSTNSELVANLNKAIKEKPGAKLDVNVKYSDFVNNGQGGFVIENNKLGPDSNFKVSCVTDPSIIPTSKEGKYLEATIKSSNGEIKYGAGAKVSASNTVSVDGITLNFNKECTNVTITGKTDVKELKDKIVSFVNDYNKLIEKLNSTVNSKHDRSYTPLTAEQKKEMSESEVKLWNERVEKGQLYRDSDITRIANSMKDSMRTFMESSGLNLKEIGIEPVKDYSGNLNGTFTIDESKLTEALENNTEDVMKLFITPSPTETDLNGKTLSEQQKMKSQTGILFKLKNIIDDEFKKSTSSRLLKKAGFDGTTTFANNELSKSITDYEKRIKDMEKNFSRREQQLYSKYATLEKMMNKLNSQQSNLMSQLGLG